MPSAISRLFSPSPLRAQPPSDTGVAATLLVMKRMLLMALLCCYMRSMPPSPTSMPRQRSLFHACSIKMFVYNACRCAARKHVFRHERAEGHTFVMPPAIKFHIRFCFVCSGLFLFDFRHFAITLSPPYDAAAMPSYTTPSLPLSMLNIRPDYSPLPRFFIA